MRSMVIDRRRFLAGAAGAAAGAMVAPAWGVGRRVLWLAANADHARQYALGAFDQDGECRFEVELPGRGHGIAIAPGDRHCVVLARRPGTFAAVVDVVAGQAVAWMEAPAGRHFHGHGVFSADGRALFTSENDFTAGHGVIGVWDAGDGYRRLGELPAHGIEPHDIRLMPDGRTLVVANGGIRTEPDKGRARLNLDDMDSSLVHLDVRDGRLIGQWRLPAELKLLSIRHLAVNQSGETAIGLQHQSEEAIVPIVGLKRSGTGITLLEMPADLAGGMRNYCGSVAMDAGGKLFAASCPRGNSVTFWEAESGRFLGAAEVSDGCGVAADLGAGGILMTSGAGGAWRWHPAEGTRRLFGGYANSKRWDNHALAVAPSI